MKQDAASSFSFIEPMKALSVRDLPSGDWVYEMKFDGYRALAFIDSLKSLSSKYVILDGEIAALDDDGKSSFQLLQSYGSGKQIPLVYYAFDLLALEGTDLRSRPLTDRRKLVARVLKKAPDNIRFSEELQGTNEELLQVARRFQLEGLIAKRLDSVYEPGRRSGAWVKIKLTQQQEFVIGGYTPPEGSRKYFGALLVGYYGPDGLHFAGRVGTGFSEKALAACTRACKKSKARAALSLTCQRKDQDAGAYASPIQS
jgi:bifunctional non-homologous end joining protein LigD